MSDVAKLAGVSLKSVSRVINDESHVSPKLRNKVQAAIDELEYVPDMAARSLAGSRNFTLGLLFANPSPSYTMKLQTGAYDACRAAGYHLRIDHLDAESDEAELDRALREVLRGSRVDGFILTPPLTESQLIMNRLEECGIPFSRVAPVVELERGQIVDFDDLAASRAVADHLVDLGHHHFGFVAGPESHGRAPKRREGFASRVREVLPDAQIVEAQGAFTFRSGLEAGRKLLESPNPPTAIFAANDDMAAGVMTAALQLRYRVPEDLSVVGFDDSWIAHSVWPPLTTIHQPISEMARLAVQQLLDRSPDSSRARQLDFSLTLRSSTGPLP